MKQTLKFYEISWSDSETENGWEKPDELKCPKKLGRSRGWFVKQNEDYFTIAADYDEETKMFNRFL